MFSILAALRTLILPYGQPANVPQIVINEDPVRAELQTFYSGRVIADFIFQKNSQTYVYMAFVNPVFGLPFLAFGAIESVGFVMHEAFKIMAGTIGGNARTFFSGDLITLGLFNPAMNRIKTAEPTNNTTVLTADPELAFIFEKAGRYKFDGIFWWSSPAAQGFQAKIDSAGGYVPGVDWNARWSVARTPDTLVFDNAALGLASTGGFQAAFISGEVTTNTGAVDLGLFWSQQVAGAGPTFILLGSNIEFMRVA